VTDVELHRREWIEERAAIREFDADMPREIAEIMARADWPKYVADREGEPA
jgi:hypothetical protein